MEEKLKEMFPEGQWGTGQKAWMVKDGTYFCAAAEIVDGEVSLTELGRRLLGSAPAEVVVVAQPEPVVIPEFVPPKQEPKPAKRAGLKV